MHLASYIVAGSVVAAIVAAASPAVGDLAFRAVLLGAILAAAWRLRK